MWWKYLALVGCIWFMDSVCGQCATCVQPLTLEQQFLDRFKNLDEKCSSFTYLYPGREAPNECLQLKEKVRISMQTTVPSQNVDSSQQSSQRLPIVERVSNIPSSHSVGNTGIKGGSGGSSINGANGLNGASGFSGVLGASDVNGVNGWSTGVPANGMNGVQGVDNSYNYMPGSDTQGYTPQHAGASMPLRNAKFTKNMYREIATQYPQDNILFSPISLETILALTYTGAVGKTSSELRSALGLPADIQSVHRQFSQLPKTQVNSNAELIMANKLYYSPYLTVNQDFNASANNYFDAETERINFAQNQNAAKKINNWVATRTHNKIKNLIQPQTLDPGTSAILVNAIYFKAKWAKEFSRDDTDTARFLAYGREPRNVEMMNNEDIFPFAHFDDLKAKVLQLPYKDTDHLSMLIMLPDNVNGLADMETRLKDIDLRQLPQSMQSEMVQVHIPKFRIEFEQDMIPTLRRLGINLLFSEQAQLTKMFREQAVGVSKVQHKAYIDVNEAGSEAAAATFNKLTPLSLPTNIKEFRADHPFMFAIVSPQAVYFVGHIVKI